MTIENHCNRLVEFMKLLDSCVVALSGGVDSAVVCKAAKLALGDRAIAATASSSSVSQDELKDAIDVARQIGIRHEIVNTDEFANPDYTRNAPDRCYHCKTELYSQIVARMTDWKVERIANGANADDTGDYRPGMKAAGELEVISPLLECGLNKSDVRAIAKHWGLTVHDKPASPCLSSRVAYGEEVNSERLAMIERGESFLRARGLREVRVRYHKGDLARIELPAVDIEAVLSNEFRDELTREFSAIGFRFITLDLQGFRSGNLNKLIPQELLRIGGNQ